MRLGFGCLMRVDARRALPNFAKSPKVVAMPTMNISLPVPLKEFVDGQVVERGFGTSSEYVRELIRKEQDRQHLRGLLLAGVSSGVGEVADAAYFDTLRQRVRRAESA